MKKDSETPEIFKSKRNSKQDSKRKIVLTENSKPKPENENFYSQKTPPRTASQKRNSLDYIRHNLAYDFKPIKIKKSKNKQMENEIKDYIKKQENDISSGEKIHKKNKLILENIIVF